MTRVLHLTEADAVALYMTARFSQDQNLLERLRVAIERTFGLVWRPELSRFTRPV